MSDSRRRKRGINSVESRRLDKKAVSIGIFYELKVYYFIKRMGRQVGRAARRLLTLDLT